MPVPFPNTAQRQTVDFLSRCHVGEAPSLAPLYSIAAPDGIRATFCGYSFAIDADGYTIPALSCPTR